MEQTALINFEDMRNIDVRIVDLNTLTDIRDIKIDIEKPLNERMLDYLNKIHNPYFFKYGKMIIKLSFAETDVTIEECMEGYFKFL